MGWLIGGAALLVVLFSIWIIGLYNGLVRTRNAYRNAFAQIDVQLTRRHDLIPNLVEVAKGYLKHERETLQAVVEARNASVIARTAATAKPGDPGAMRDLSDAERALNASVGRLYAVAEAYPNLKANQNMLQLQEELTSTENRVAFARQAYNDAVMGYNIRREVFPSNILASLFRFTAAALFEIDDERQRSAPQAQF